MLEKWEEANLKIFEKHPIHSPEDLGVLEEALEQVHGVKKDQEDEMQKLIISPGNKKFDPKEQAVKAYLKRIHNQEEDMLLKAKEGEEAVRNKRRLELERQKQKEEEEKL